MLTGRRFNRIFRPDGRALIVAMDHGLFDGPCKGLEKPAETIARVVAGGADAVLTSYSVALRFARELAPVGLILRADGGATSLGQGGGPGALFFGVEDALRLGADAVAVTAFPGLPKEEATLGPDRIVWNQDGKEMVHIPADKFLYGDKKLLRELPDFWIDTPPSPTPSTLASSRPRAAETLKGPVPASVYPCPPGSIHPAGRGIGYGGMTTGIIPSLFWLLERYRLHTHLEVFPVGNRNDQVMIRGQVHTDLL